MVSGALCLIEDGHLLIPRLICRPGRHRIAYNHRRAGKEGYLAEECKMVGTSQRAKWMEERFRKLSEL